MNDNTAANVPTTAPVPCPTCGTCPTCGAKKPTDAIPAWPWPYQTWPSVPVEPPTFVPWWSLPPVTCGIPLSNGPVMSTASGWSGW